MGKTVFRPEYIKYRREEDYGLVYDHENYGYEDATLTTVDARIISCLEFVDEKSAVSIEALKNEVSSTVVETALDRGFLDVS